ncbi:hypothetical protein [Corynebacterium lubricantis]|uniref:hypothetical protein n=1 Tax=Corynebacterium lubricantis TaxID=541095 RepID=UPI0003812E72|nr:hypothetical protein [Corynebacterium lubricantis]
MSIHQTPLASSTPATNKTRRKAMVGTAAGLLFFALVAGLVLGALWGAFRPAYVGDITDGMFIANETESPRNVEFSSFASYILITGVLGIVVAMVAYLKVGHAAGVGMLIWVGIVAFAATFAFYVFGNIVTGWVHPYPDPSGGDVTGAHIVPPMSPGVGWAVAPLLAVLTYWIQAIVSSPDPEPEPLPGRTI